MSKTTIPKFILRQVQHKRAANPRRIGIYAGTFDPVHSGHITFALQAMQTAQLDELVFLPERRPRHKAHAEHFGHRVAMLTRAIAPHPQMSVAELVDVRFTVSRTLRHLKALFPHDTLVFLVGSDVVAHMTEWADIETLLKSSELVVGIRQGQTEAAVYQMMAEWPVTPLAAHVVMSYAADISSSLVREALRRREQKSGVLTSVIRYASQNWLYVSVPSHPVKG